MNAAHIAAIIAALGPPALQLIQDLVSLWEKPTLTAEEVNTILSKAKKSYDEYIAEARGMQTKPLS